MKFSLMTFPMMEDVRAGKMDFMKICEMAETVKLHHLDIMEMEVKLHGFRKIKQMLSQFQIDITCMVSFVPFLLDNESEINEKLKTSITMAKRLGINQLMIVPFYFSTSSRLKEISKETQQTRLVKYFRIAVAMADSEGIRVCFENFPSIDIPMAMSEDCRFLLERVPGLGLVYDTGNMLVEGEDPIHFYRELKQYICHVHLKDVRYINNSGRGDQTRDGRVFTNCLWGEGVIPFESIMTMLYHDGYQGTAAIEFCNPDGSGTFTANMKQLTRFMECLEKRPEFFDGASQIRNGKVFGWAIIGAGVFAEMTGDTILKTGKYKIVSVYNRTFSKAEAVAEKWGATPFETIEQAVETEGVEGVYIATTTNYHFQAAKKCLELGKSVLLEKPFTVSKAQAQELINLAREKKVYLVEGMWTWFSPVSLQVKKWVRSNFIGKITDVKISYAIPAIGFTPRLSDANLVGGALMDLGVYPLTYCYNLFGKPVKVECKGILSGGVDTEEEVTLTYKDDMKVTAFISMIRSKGGEKLVLAGEKGTIKCFQYHSANRATLIDSNGKKTIFTGNGRIENEFNCVAEEILNGLTESRYVPFQSTLDNMETMDECRRQMGLVYPCELSEKD